MFFPLLAAMRLTVSSSSNVGASRSAPSSATSLRASERGVSSGVPTGLILSAIVTLLLLYNGWRGWEMVYRNHVGVSDDTAGGG